MADPVSVAVLNMSTTLSDAEIEPLVAAYQEDVGQNFAAWSDARVTVAQVRTGDPAPAGWWQLAFLDDATQAGALGFHELTTQGLPLGKVFVRTTQACGQTPSRVGNHELWEMLVDPWLNRYTTDWDRAYCIEVGDLLSLDDQGREGLGGVLLSGIALPAAYFANYGTRYDIGGRLTQGLPHVEPAEGAYLMWQGGAGFEANAAAPHFIQSPPLDDPDDFLHLQAAHGSRRHRRIMGSHAWRRSAVAVR